VTHSLPCYSFSPLVVRFDSSKQGILLLSFAHLSCWFERKVFAAFCPMVVAQIGHTCQADYSRHTDSNIWVAISRRMPLQITVEGHCQLMPMSWFTTELWPDAHTDKIFYCALRDIFSKLVSIWEPLSVWILLCTVILSQTLKVGFFILSFWCEQ